MFWQCCVCRAFRCGSPDRDERWPLIIAGGPCVCNAEPMADFFDVMQLGEGEQMLQDICAAVEQGKKRGWDKEQLLLELAKIPGVYVPSFYDVTYKEDGRIEAVTPNRPGVPPRVTQGHRAGYGQLYPAGKLRGAA